MTPLRVLSRLFLLLIWFGSMALSLALLAPVGRLVRAKRWQSARIIPWHLRAISHAIGLRIRWQGACPPSSTFLMLANHASYLDVIALGSLCPLGFMAKQEVSAWPLIGFLAKRGTAVFVDRECPGSRVRALFAAKRILRDQISSLCIFPEGTTTAAVRPSLKTWHRGNIALSDRGRIETLCVGLHYEDHASLAWIDDQGLLPHLVKVLARRKVELFINAQTLNVSEDVSPRAMSQLAHKTICRLSDSAAERAQYAKARHQWKSSPAHFFRSQPWMFSTLDIEKSQKD